MTWHGWIWDTRRQRWDKVCEAEGLSACSARLGEIVRIRGTKEKYATMTGGKEPTFRPAGRRQRETHSFAQETRSDDETARTSTQEDKSE